MKKLHVIALDPEPEAQSQAVIDTGLRFRDRRLYLESSGSDSCDRLYRKTIRERYSKLFAWPDGTEL